MDNKEFEKKLQQIKTFKEVPISVDEKIQKAFERIEENERVEKEVKKQKSKFNFSRVLSLAASFVMVIFLAGNGVAYAKGEPNIYSWVLEKLDIRKEYKDKENGEYTLEYSQIDENNNIIWNYSTDSTLEAQYNHVDTLAITNDKIYINENGVIVALNKENGKVIWKSDVCKETEGAFDSVYLDKNQNLYIYRGDVTVIDKDGKKRAEISVSSTDGVEFEYISDEKLLISGAFGYAIINLNNYRVEESLSLNSFDEDTLIEKKDGNDKVTWKYKLKDNMEIDCLMSSDWKYYIENKIILFHELGIITALDLETGKVVWKNSDFEGLYFSGAIFDSKNNIYSSIDEGPDLCIIDKNGKTIKKVEHFYVEDKIGADEVRTMCVVEFRNNEKELVMKYKNVLGAYMIVNLEDYSITYENIEE